jgi:hypothetical protein
MIKQKIAFSLIALFIVSLLNAFDCFAQAVPRTQVEPSYEVVLQTLNGSNNVAKTDVPPMLSGVIKKLKTNYSYTSYRIVSTSVQRIGSSGAIESKSVSNEAVGNQDRNFSVFSEWTLNGLQNLPDAKGQNSVQFQSFRFGQRIPVGSGLRDESGKTNPVVNYEQIGLTVQRFSLPVGAPTVIGSLPASKTDETTFLVLTVKSAEE